MLVPLPTTIECVKALKVGTDKVMCSVQQLREFTGKFAYQWSYAGNLHSAKCWPHSDCVRCTDTLHIPVIITDKYMIYLIKVDHI